MYSRSAVKAVICAGLLAAVPWVAPLAAAKNQATVLPAGSIACLTLKDSKNFDLYTKESPKFAADMLDRATCFKAKENMDAMVLSAAEGYTRLKLLSGHTIWYRTSK